MGEYPYFKSNPKGLSHGPWRKCFGSNHCSDSKSLNNLLVDILIKFVTFIATAFITPVNHMEEIWIWY